MKFITKSYGSRLITDFSILAPNFDSLYFRLSSLTVAWSSLDLSILAPYSDSLYFRMCLLLTLHDMKCILIFQASYIKLCATVRVCNKESEICPSKVIVRFAHLGFWQRKIVPFRPLTQTLVETALSISPPKDYNSRHWFLPPKPWEMLPANSYIARANCLHLRSSVIIFLIFVLASMHSSIRNN